MSTFQSSNLIYIHKLGEAGTVLTAVLSDRDGTVNLTSWTITMNIEGLVADAPCTPANQTTNEGQLSCTISGTPFDDLAASLIEKSYNAEFTLTNGAVVHKFPKSADGKRTYFTFKTQESL